MTTKGAFTPGPWGAASRQGDDWLSVVYTQRNSDVEICQCFHERGNKDSCEANANLIAAAPEMYEALNDKRFGSTGGFLRKIAEQLEEDAQRQGEEWHSIYAPRLNAIADEMDAAIAKAEGGQG